MSLRYQTPSRFSAPPGRRGRPFLAACAVALSAACAVPATTGAAPSFVWHAAAPRASTAVTPPSRPITRPTWLPRVTITEYYPVPEAWFTGRRVQAAGLPSPHRVDWLFSARGVTMEGDGIGLDGRRYHVVNVGRGGWVDELGRPMPLGGSRPIFWRAGGFWRNARNQLTFPLEEGGWSNGAGARYVPLSGVSFAPGPSLPLTYYHSLAVDPRLIPLGSRVYIPAYRSLGGGWFTAQDTGGAIRGAHVDVFRRPPASPAESSRYLTSQRVYVVPRGQPARTPPSGPAPAPPQTGAGGGLASG